MDLKRKGLAGGLACLMLVLGLLGVALAGNTGGLPERAELTAEAQYAQAQASMLYLRCFYPSGALKTTGSGFVVSGDGLVVTAAHVVDKAAWVNAVLPGGEEVLCTVESCNTDEDLALLRLPAGQYPALPLADQAPGGGAVLRAMGYPIRDTLLITEGLVACPVGKVNEKERMLVTCDLVNGMSGGPILDRFGQVVGVASGSVRTMSGVHLSVLPGVLMETVQQGKEK